MPDGISYHFLRQNQSPAKNRGSNSDAAITVYYFLLEKGLLAKFSGSKKLEIGFY